MTPLGSLAFQYAEGIKGFNSQKGLFDVAIEGDTTATAFKLTSRLITNTLTQLDTSGSTLSVGVDYNGAAVEKNWRYRDDRYRQQYYGRQPQRAG
ncbi:CFA/I fimbrial major subunit [Klebsiella pneumoniae ISC21]|nr:CFA/I fimbrial major subunit [Klebsiella pneumoniae ISC21]